MTEQTVWVGVAPSVTSQIDALRKASDKGMEATTTEAAILNALVGAELALALDRSRKELLSALEYAAAASRADAEASGAAARTLNRWTTVMAIATAVLAVLTGVQVANVFGWL